MIAFVLRDGRQHSDFVLRRVCRAPHQSPPGGSRPMSQGVSSFRIGPVRGGKLAEGRGIDAVGEAPRVVADPLLPRRPWTDPGDATPRIAQAAVHAV
eukprot:8000414-Heterocapsa_arctica.AAC.1